MECSEERRVSACHPLDHVFDAAFGANDSVPNQIYIGRDGVAELYSNLTGPSTAPANNYSSTVIGSDGADFNDFSVSFSAVAHEVPVTGFSHIHRPKHEPDGPGEINDFLCAVATKESTSKHSPEQSRMHFLKRFWSRQFTTLAFTCPSLEKIRGVISVALICPLSVLSSSYGLGMIVRQ